MTTACISTTQHATVRCELGVLVLTPYSSPHAVMHRGRFYVACGTERVNAFITLIQICYRKSASVTLCYLRV